MLDDETGLAGLGWLSCLEFFWLFLKGESVGESKGRGRERKKRREKKRSQWESGKKRTIGERWGRRRSGGGQSECCPQKDLFSVPFFSMTVTRRTRSMSHDIGTLSLSAVTWLI
jgi:hypothetical protein